MFPRFASEFLILSQMLIPAWIPERMPPRLPPIVSIYSTGVLTFLLYSIFRKVSGHALAIILPWRPNRRASTRADSTNSGWGDNSSGRTRARRTGRGVAAYTEVITQCPQWGQGANPASVLFSADNSVIIFDEFVLRLIQLEPGLQVHPKFWGYPQSNDLVVARYRR